MTAAGAVAAVAVAAAVLLAGPVGPRRVDGLSRAPGRPPWGWLSGRWWGRRRARVRRAARDQRAREACSVLAEELRAGRDPGSALRCAVEVCPELGPVVQAYDLGADVPQALRRTGVPALTRVAGAWHVAHASGRGLGETLRAVSEDLRREQGTRRVVAAELASARATARLLVGLPAVAHLVGTAGGAAPWRFFVSGPVGVLCAVVGVGLLAAGLGWIERIADSVEAQA